MNKYLAIGISAIVIVVLCLSVFFMGVGYKNDEVELRNQAVAQQESNKVIYDKVWKVISQKAQIADKYQTSFKEIYGSIMDSRYQGEAKQAPLFKFVAEHNPNFSTKLYEDLSDAIEANRAEFARVQNRLIDIKREHDNLRMKFPGSAFVGDKPELKIEIVTSGKTKETFNTGEENDVNLFNK
jgi:hypothetical protein